MNIRSLTRGDGVVIGAAVLLFVASFLSIDSCSGSYCESASSANSWDLLGLGLGTYMTGVIGAALIAVARMSPQPMKVVGLELGQVGIVLTLVTAWSSFWWIIDSGDAGAGLILGLIASLVLAGGAVATSLVPALKPALIGAPRPQTPQPYGAQPQGGYGYPGAQQQQPYGAQPGQPGQPGQPQQGGQPFGGQPQQAQAPQSQGGQPGAAQPAGDFSPFWFAVPVQRPLYGEDGSPTPIAELAPGTWYLAVEQRGPGLIAQTQDGRRGVLQDTTGIQRG